MSGFLSDDSFIASHRQVFIAGYANPIHLVDYKPESYQDALYDQYDIAKPALNSQWMPRRRSQFLAGRLAAKQALTFHQQSLAQVQVLVGGSREPIWPNKILGSISHSEATSIVSVSRQSSAKSGLGIDIQQLIDADFQAQISSTVLTEKDSLLLAFNSSKLASSLLFTVIFSAKESFFKAVFNTVGQYFDFSDVSIVELNVNQQRLILKTRKHLSEEIPKGFEAVIYFSTLEAATTRVITICQWEL